MARTNPPRAIANKVYTITPGTRQRDLIDEAANVLNITPRQLAVDGAMEACKDMIKAMAK
ncbi:hypothetical protein NLO83_25335 [Pseudomonas tremae]|uniref:hypothetical protein n=1 Tax=Pseudomonas syringae group TaxID=136849 RepID=UPI0001AF6018|nr:MULTISPECIES: hypothetical protein [Pseudomonas syringae group]MCQ3018894.1 hypothetical protein [Pseudomonas tremae]QGL57418.1 hypothetical protein POR16_14260 [Pseudomonas coronafaciens pv. oryzae str. 1_6]RMM31877.1 hypothetical protein ALQ80_02068 [Pseudomonas coronafaciens pv. oryzae]